MDPEQILRFAERARSRGWTDAQINARLQELDVPHNSLEEVRQAAIRSGATAARAGSARPGEAPPPDKSAFTGFGAHPFLAADVATFGMLDEMEGVARALGALVPGGMSPGEAFDEGTRAGRQRLQTIRQGAGLGTKAAGLAGGLTAAAIGPTLAGQGARAAAAGAPFARGALVGGAEGALTGVGTADPDPDLSLGESLQERAGEAVVPGAIGAATGGILGSVAAGRAASRAKPRAGARLGQAARRESGLSGRASKVTRDAAEQQSRISRELYKPLEELGGIEHPSVRRALGSDDVKPVVQELFPEIAEGRAPTFLELQKVKSRLEGLRDRAVRSGDSFELDKWGEAANDVVEAMGDAIPDRFPEAQRAWATQAARLRALEKGRKLWSRTADDVQEAFRKLDGEAEQQAFREGLATEFVAKAEKLTRPVQLLRRVQNSPQTRAKLKILFGSEDRLQRFTREVLGEERLRSRAHLFERILRWAPIAAATGGGGAAGAGILSQ